MAKKRRSAAGNFRFRGVGGTAPAKMPAAGRGSRTSGLLGAGTKVGKTIGGRSRRSD